MPKRLSKIKIRDEIRIVYFGTPEFSGYVLEKLIDFCQNPPKFADGHIGSVHENQPRFLVQTVVTGPDKVASRKNKIVPSAVSLVAEKYGIRTLKPLTLDENFMKAHLPFLDSDLFVVAAYGKILPQKMLEIPTFGALNIHPSLLPKYRGASPIQAAILNGDEVSGISIIKMDAEMDHGPIVYQEEFKILKPRQTRLEQVQDDTEPTFDSLSKKMFARAAEILPSIIRDFVSGTIQPRLQIHARATFCTQVKKEDGYFEINNPPSAEKLDRMIRAYYPWPSAWTIWRAKEPKESDESNGKIVKFLPGGLIQMEGKKAVPLKDFLNGYPDFPVKNLI